MTFMIVTVLLATITVIGLYDKDPEAPMPSEETGALDSPLVNALLSGDTKSVRLIYSSTDPLMFLINGEVYRIQEPNATLIAEFHGTDFGFAVNLTLSVSGEAQVYKGGRYERTLDEFKYTKSLLLTWIGGAYYLENISLGGLPLLVVPQDRVPILSVYVAKKGGEIFDGGLVDVYAENPIELVFDVEKGIAHVPRFNVSFKVASIPPVYRKIAELTGRGRLTLLSYSSVSYGTNLPVLPFSNSLIIERTTGIALSFDLVGAPRVRSDATLTYNGREYEYYPVSPLGSLFNVSVPVVLFQLRELEIAK